MAAHRPPASSAGVAARMSRARRRDTAPEIAIRREAHRRGLRYRVDAPVIGLPRRRPDIVFTRQRVSVFVDGCFWHSCPAHATHPKSNKDWWAAKLERNVVRDLETDDRLRELGWTVLRFWEHEDPIAAVDVIERVVRPSSPTPQTPA